MNKYEYPTAFKSWGPEEHEAIQRVIKSDYYTMGPEVEAFESEFADWHGRKYGIMVNSGSSANLISVLALCHRWRLKDNKVIVPSIAWSTTYAPLIQCGFNNLVLVDVDETWNSNLIVGDREADLIVTCSILGNPNNSFVGIPILKYFVPILEDNCESLGARVSTAVSSTDNALCGTFGTLSTFSFYHSHQISAIEGGMVLTDDEKLARWCRIVRAHGWTRDVEKPQSFDDEYNFTHFGYNVRPLEIHAAIAREQLKKLPEFIEQRIANLNLFECGISTYHLPIKLQKRQGKPSPFGLAFTCESKEIRQKLITALRANSIDCRLPTGGSFRKHPYGKPWAYQQTPNADRIHDTGLFLGNAPWDISDLIEKAVKVMKDTL